jgi:hypothetical protein
MLKDRVIEEILSAWWEWERCDPSRKAASLETLNCLLDETRQGTLYSRQQILDHLYSHFLEFKRVRTGTQTRPDRPAAGEGPSTSDL